MPLQSAEAAGYQARWVAWVARGAAHDRAIRRRLVVVVPPAIVVALIVFAWLVR
jgi:hypothetical protein